MVPFYRQGMNCGFGDCFIFMDLLEKNGFSFNEAAREYSATRCADMHAICDLAMYNYIEVHVNNWSYLVKKKIDKLLHCLTPRTFIPLCTMVSFTQIPYATIVA